MWAVWRPTIIRLCYLLDLAFRHLRAQGRPTWAGQAYLRHPRSLNAKNRSKGAVFWRIPLINRGIVKI